MSKANNKKLNDCSIVIPNPYRKGLKRKKYDIHKVISTGVTFSDILSEVVPSETGDTGFIIPFNVPLTEWQLHYIQDCWVDFVTQDLGYKPADLPLICF